MKVTVIIPAAGMGTRMIPAAGSTPSSQTVKTAGEPPVPAAPKQFAEIRGVPVIVHALRAFAGSPQVDRIVVATLGSAKERLQEEIRKYSLTEKITIVIGGKNRQESVANALATVSGDDDDIVLVHDAVRPFVTAEIIRNVIEGVRKHGAAIAGVPAIDTIKQVERTGEGAIISTTIPRERIVLAQTPQGFRLGLLRRTFAEALADGFVGTDEASLVERAGHPVAVVMGSARNFKITTPGDIALAEFYFDQGE